MLIRDEHAVVESIETVEQDGAPAVALRVRFTDDGRTEAVSLRPDLIPDGLDAGDEVLIQKAALYRRWTIRRAADG